MYIYFSIHKGFSKCLILLFLLYSYTSEAQNLITNGSFANSTANWQFIAPAVDVEAYLPETSYGGPSGTNIVAEIDGGANLRQTAINVTPGQTYWLSFRCSRRTSGGAPNPTTFTVNIYDGTNNFLNQTITCSNNTWNWQCKTFQFTPTGNTVNIDFISVSTGTLGTLVDDITITPLLQPITLTGLPCQNGDITLSAPSFPNDPNAVYSNFNWTGPGGFTASTQNITLNNLQQSMSGDYICTMQLNTCLTVTGTYHLDIAPTISDQTVSICLGQSYNFYGKILMQPGDYDTTIGNINGCDERLILHLIVNPLPNSTINPNGHSDICEGDTLIISSLNTLQNCSYRWMNNGAILPNETGNILYAYASGNYQVEVTSNMGCVVTSSLLDLNVHQPPIASIKINEADNPCISDTLHFNSANEAATYNWSPGSVFRNTASVDQQNAAGIIQHDKTEVILTVYDEVGCHTSDSVLVNARECCYLFLPNVFTPNGDALNDVFRPSVNATQKIVSFRIFDRWGKMVYSNTVNGLGGWNGTYPNGEKASADVYMYSIEYTCGDSKPELKKGDITLIR